MSALSIQPTYPIFTDIDGQPLEAGYVWIGTANLDPQTNPINVYWDAALTLPAAQPIRTLAGYPANSGTPARLYVNSDYSIRVMNKNGSSVYSAPAATERYSEAVVSSVNAANVVYDPPFTGGVQTNAEAKLAQIVSVKDFGAVGDGVTDDTAAIQAALNVGGHIIFPTGVYRCDTVLISKDTNIDFQGSTVKRYTAGSSRIFQSSAAGKLTMRNGIVDGDNSAANRGMLLQYEDAAGTLVLENMTWQNNCKLDAPNEPTKSQDTDLVYVLKAAALYVDGCVFNRASRQGISVVDATAEIKIVNSVFEDCYLYGIDIEPNTYSTYMYENVLIEGNTFRNCGTKSATDSVWPTSGTGPFSLASHGAPSLGTLIAQNVVFANNTVISNDFLTPSVSLVEPLIRIAQFKSLSFTGNSIDNIDLFQICPFQTTPSEDAVFSGNTITTSGMNVNLFTTDQLNNFTLSGNSVVSVNVAGPNAIIANNRVSGTLTIAATNNRCVIDGNTFAFTIDNSAKTTNLTITGNYKIGGGALYSTTLAGSSVASGNSDGVVFARHYAASTSTIFSIPSATPTTVLSLAGLDKVGMISVIDTSGTRIGAYANFANFHDGTNNSPFLTGVQNSGVSGSALTLSGTDIQFAHTFGSARNLQVNVLFIGGDAP